MILLAANKRDVTTDFVVLELRRRGVDYVRLNTEDIAEFEIAMPGGDPAAMSLRGPRGSFELARVTGAYYRRPGQPAAVGSNDAITTYLTAEWSAVLRTLWNVLEGRWLNSPFSILRAEDKPRQLAVARQAGFRVPDTLVTNGFDDAKAFVAAGAAIGKPLRQSLLDDGALGSVIFTSRVTELRADDAASVRQAPVIFQREVPKSADVRVIVVDDQLFATRIGSQAHKETEVDWRSGVRLDLSHEPMPLPNDAAAACLAVTRMLNLRFAAIDLVEDKAGDFWFLEANPNGQWAWIEQRTGAPVTAAIVDALAR